MTLYIRRAQDPRTNEILRLIDKENLSYAKIGDRLGISRQRVAQIVERARPGFSRPVGRRKSPPAEGQELHEALSNATSARDAARRARMPLTDLAKLLQGGGKAEHWVAVWARNRQARTG